MWNLKNTNESTAKQNRLTDIENKLMVTEVEREKEGIN